MHNLSAMKTKLPAKSAFLFPLSIIPVRGGHLKVIVLSVALMLISCTLCTSQGAYPTSHAPGYLLGDLLSGEYDEGSKAVKWYATPGDIIEFNGQLGENGALYSLVDTTVIVQRGDDKVYYTIFRTAPMITNEEGDFVNASNCHVCGVNLGYFSYIIENDSIYVNKFKRSFATHGSFGAKSYSLSMINLGDGYELLKVDDPYEGMGTTSVATRFYWEGELMLGMISEENNRGSRDKDQKGYYEFKTDFTYDQDKHSIIVDQKSYRMDEKRGRRISLNKTRNLVFDGYTLQF